MSSESNVIQKSTYKPVLFWGGLITLIWITFLLYAGGFTTSIRAGMAFLDWPLSNGSINPEGWLENDDMMAEHSHRLLGMVMGLLSIGLCVAAFSTKARPQIRKLGIALVVLVVVQGLLGGLRVKLDASEPSCGTATLAWPYRPFRSLPTERSSRQLSIFKSLFISPIAWALS